MHGLLLLFLSTEQPFDSGGAYFDPERMLLRHNCSNSFFQQDHLPTPTWIWRNQSFGRSVDIFLYCFQGCLWHKARPAWCSDKATDNKTDSRKKKRLTISANGEEGFACLSRAGRYRNSVTLNSRNLRTVTQKCIPTWGAGAGAAVGIRRRQIVIKNIRNIFTKFWKIARNWCPSCNFSSISRAQIRTLFSWFWACLNKFHNILNRCPKLVPRISNLCPIHQ